MRPEIEALVILQNKDSEIQKLETELTNIPKARAVAKERLSDDTAAVAEAKSATQGNAVTIKNKELDIDTRKNTINRLRQQQFETKKNDEYTALANEVVRYTNEVDELETGLLELMEKADGLSSAQKKANDRLSATQTLVDEELSQLDTKEATIKEQLAAARSERESLVTNVTESDYSLYTRLLKSKGGQALAEVSESGQCLGCHIKLVPATIVKLRAQKETVLCENCSRIIYEI